jgi:hypothetical protein
MKFLGRKTVKTEKTSAPKSSKAVKPSKTSTAATPAKTPTAPAPAATPTRRAPTYEEIAARSYELYLARGAEPGHAEEDWLKAEAELS